MPFWYQSIVGYLSVGSWFMLTAHTAVISVNRLVAVAVYTKYRRIFSTLNTVLMIIVCYLYGFAMVTTMYACKCRLVFPEYAWLFDCKFDTCAKAALNINQIISNATVAFVAFIYIVIFFTVSFNEKALI